MMKQTMIQMRKNLLKLEELFKLVKEAVNSEKLEKYSIFNLQMGDWIVMKFDI